MGLFDSDYKTQVGTSVSRVVKDNLLPNSIKTGVLKSIVKSGEITDYIMEEIVASIGIHAERMYDYAKLHYPHGLPSGQMMSSTQGKTEVEAILAGIEGGPVLIEYSHYGPPNKLHLGWMALLSSYGYDPVTNKLGPLSVLKKKPVYLKDMQVVIPDSKVSQVEAGGLAQWGTPPNGGYTPERPASLGLLATMASHSAVITDATATSESLLVTYIWQEAPPSLTSESSKVNLNILEGTFSIPLTGYIGEADYFHVKYTVGGVDKYWMYKVGSGTYPTLDTVFNTPPEVNGTYFPFTYFRYNKHSTNSDKSTEAYKSSKKLVKYLGMNYDKVADAINDNPDIADVEQAMLVFAVPAKTDVEIERRYLYTFFDNLFYGAGDQFGSEVKATIVERLKGAPGDDTLTKTSIVIQDKQFKMALSNGGIYKKRVVGNIGVIGSHSSGIDTINVQQVFLDYQTNEYYSQDRPVKYHYYRKQITEVLYDEIQVVNLKMMYHIFENYTATGDEEDDILLIPIDRSITETYTISEREELFSRSLHYVFNSRVVTEIKWYQSDFFQFAILVVAVAIAISSIGPGAAGLIEAIIAGSVELITTQVIVLVTQLVVNALIAEGFKLFVKAVGGEAALVIAVIAAVVGGVQAIEAGSINGAPWAKDLLALATGLAKGISADLKDKISDLIGEANDFKVFMEEQTKLLDDTNKLLENNNILSPFVLFGEAPKDYFNRTIHSGNVGVLGIEAISSYVKIALTLPSIEDSLGSNNYANV